MQVAPLVRGQIMKMKTMHMEAGKGMTLVYCEFVDCIYNKDKLCDKETIWLDKNVADINIGCPDAEWGK